MIKNFIVTALIAVPFGCAVGNYTAPEEVEDTKMSESHAHVDDIEGEDSQSHRKFEVEDTGSR